MRRRAVVPERLEDVRERRQQEVLDVQRLDAELPGGHAESEHDHGGDPVASPRPTCAANTPLGTGCTAVGPALTAASSAAISSASSSSSRRAAKPVAHLGDELEEARLLARVGRSRLRQVDVHDAGDPPGPRAT